MMRSRLTKEIELGHEVLGQLIFYFSSRLYCSSSSAWLLMCLSGLCSSLRYSPPSDHVWKQVCEGVWLPWF